jgi:hypothetical protein
MESNDRRKTAKGCLSTIVPPALIGAAIVGWAAMKFDSPWPNPRVFWRVFAASAFLIVWLGPLCGLGVREVIKAVWGEDEGRAEFFAGFVLATLLALLFMAYAREGWM